MKTTSAVIIALVCVSLLPEMVHPVVWKSSSPMRTARAVPYGQHVHYPVALQGMRPGTRVGRSPGGGGGVDLTIIKVGDINVLLILFQEVYIAFQKLIDAGVIVNILNKISIDFILLIVSNVAVLTHETCQSIVTKAVNG